MQACIYVCLTLLSILFYVQSLVDTMLISKRIKNTQTYISNGIFESLFYVLFQTILCCTEYNNFSLAG